MVVPVSRGFETLKQVRESGLGVAGFPEAVDRVDLIQRDLPKPGTLRHGAVLVSYRNSLTKGYSQLRICLRVHNLDAGGMIV